MARMETNTGRNISRSDLGLHGIFFAVIMYSMISVGLYDGTTATTTNTTTNTNGSTPNMANSTTPTGAMTSLPNVSTTRVTLDSSTTIKANSTTPTDWNTILSVLSPVSSVLAILIMITVGIWICAHMRRRSQEQNMRWSPPPINLHLHGTDSHSLSRTPSRYRSHRADSEFDEEQPPSDNKSRKSSIRTDGVHTYNVIENCATEQKIGISAILTVDGTNVEDGMSRRSNLISEKMSDPFPMTSNPLYRTTSCVMERRGPMPLPPPGHGGERSKKAFQQNQYVPSGDASKSLGNKGKASSSSGPSGNPTDAFSQSNRSKSCDPLQNSDQSSNAKGRVDQQWSILESLDALDTLGGVGKDPTDDVFGDPDYSLIGNLPGRSRSYSLFPLSRETSFDPSPKNGITDISFRGRRDTRCSEGHDGSIPASKSERFEMVENPLCQTSSYNILERPEKTRAREMNTLDNPRNLKSSKVEQQRSQRGDDEGYQTISDGPGGVHNEYTDLK